MKQLTFIAALILAITLPATSYAAKVVIKPGVTINVLPKQHRVVKFGNRTYYIAGGHYYAKRKNHYVVVNAPIGVTVRYLPAGYTVVKVGNKRYYRTGNVHYVKVNGGFRVVKAPKVIIG